MEILKIKKNELIFNNLPDLTFKSKLPLLINQNNEVILGNSIKNCYGEEVSCIKINCIDFLKNCLYNIENELIKENNIDRLYEIEKELMEFIEKELKKEIEQITLFDYKERNFITEENYNHLPEYDFVKHNLIRKKGDDESVNLFSCFGEL